MSGKGIFATRDASGQLSWTMEARQVGERAWTAEGPFAWTGLVFTSKDDCARIDPIGDGWLSVELDRGYDGTLSIGWRYDRALATASVDCPPSGESFDPPPIPGQPGPGLVGIASNAFELPAEAAPSP